MKLIDKSALVAEIEKLEKMYCYDNKTNSGLVAISIFENINNVIDTLEVKEVDFEKEWKEFLKDGDVGFKEIAKHFFELGIAVSNPVTAADRGTAEEIIINLKRIEEDYHIDLTKEMEWLRNKVQKGEKV